MKIIIIDSEDLRRTPGHELHTSDLFISKVKRTYEVLKSRHGKSGQKLVGKKAVAEFISALI